MAAERTWLAWWRTALVATAGALGVGRLAPQLLHVPRAPYVILGGGYALLAIAKVSVVHGSRKKPSSGTIQLSNARLSTSLASHRMNRTRRGEISARSASRQPIGAVSEVFAGGGSPG